MTGTTVFRRFAWPLAIVFFAGLGASSTVMSQRPGDVFSNNTPGGIPRGTADNHGCPGGGYLTQRGRFLRCACPQNDPRCQPQGRVPQSATIRRPPGWSRPGRQPVSQSNDNSTAGQRTNGYRGLSSDQVRKGEAGYRRINDRLDVRAANTVAGALGVRPYRAEPMRSNIGTKVGFRGYTGRRNNNRNVQPRVFRPVVRKSGN